jgi:hypothetical protein
MSLIAVRDGPGVAQLAAWRAGHALVKEAAAAAISYSLSGMLYLSKSGWLLVDVPNALARGVFAALDETGIELPPSEHGQGFTAHCSVMSPEEVRMIGGPDKITERGKRFAYTLGRLKSVEPENWPGVAKVWYVRIHSPDLQALRRSYGLSGLPHGGEYEFHLTVAVRRRGVLGKNETAKQTR